MPSHQPNGPSPEITEQEWAAVDALRTSGPLNSDGRRLLARAAERLRVASLEPGPVPVDEFQVPTRSPCPYCENFAGRFASHGPGGDRRGRRDLRVPGSRADGGMPGHTLVATRRHVETIFDLTENETAALGVAVVARLGRCGPR